MDAHSRNLWSGRRGPAAGRAAKLFNAEQVVYSSRGCREDSSR
jgi:hypothetical protein